MTIVPVGETNHISISSGQECEIPFILTDATETPETGKPETVRAEGNGLAFAASTISMYPPPVMV